MLYNVAHALFIFGFKEVRGRFNQKLAVLNRHYFYLVRAFKSGGL